MKEYSGSQDTKAVAVVKLSKGVRLHGTLTRWEYKLVKYRVHMTKRGDQQVAGESFFFVATDGE